MKNFSTIKIKQKDKYNKNVKKIFVHRNLLINNFLIISESFVYSNNFSQY